LRSTDTAALRNLVAVEVPPPEPVKLLACWMEWEKGETPPGRVMSNLKTAGMKELLEQLVAQAPASA
jgi:hypothetical protein